MLSDTGPYCGLGHTGANGSIDNNEVLLEHCLESDIKSGQDVLQNPLSPTSATVLYRANPDYPFQER